MVSQGATASVQFVVTHGLSTQGMAESAGARLAGLNDEAGEQRLARDTL